MKGKTEVFPFMSEPPAGVFAPLSLSCGAASRGQSPNAPLRPSEEFRTLRPLYV